jgi:epoxide hydrolase 4
MQTEMIATNWQTFHTRLAGRRDAPLVLFLHGFPEYGGAWDGVLPWFADRYLAAAPDQRGYGRSSKPAAISDYRVQHLAADMLALAETLSPGRPIHLVGHDWGASVAYAMAFMAPSRIARLVILNGVHPLCFQRALIHDPEQRAASQYIHFLRRDDSAALLTADGCRRTLEFLTSGFGGGRWLNEDMRRGYLEAWTAPGAMAGMVAWYKATPLVVPKPGETIMNDPLSHIDPALMRVRMPHLLLWGLEDKALRPSSREGLERYCDDLRRIDVPGADHWIVHQQPDLVVREIRAFFGA